MDERNEIRESHDTQDSDAEGSALSPLFGSAKDVVNRYTHCPMCSSNLHFTHVTDFARNLTQETARCPECGIKTRQAMHRLQ